MPAGSVSRVVRPDDMRVNQWVIMAGYRGANDGSTQCEALDAATRRNFMQQFGGVPFLVRGINLPFIVVTAPGFGKLVIDTRQYVVRSAARSYVEIILGRPISRWKAALKVAEARTIEQFELTEKNGTLMGQCPAGCEEPESLEA